MLHYAKAYFQISKPDDAGKSRLKTLREIYSQTGILSPELAQLPSLPDETSHIWQWFCDLSRGRSAGMQMNAISWADICGYFELLGLRPARWEIEAIRLVDDAFMDSRSSSVSGEVKGARALGTVVGGAKKEGVDG